MTHPNPFKQDKTHQASICYLLLFFAGLLMSACSPDTLSSDEPPQLITLAAEACWPQAALASKRDAHLYHSMQATLAGTPRYQEARKQLTQEAQGETPVAEIEDILLTFLATSGGEQQSGIKVFTSCLTTQGRITSSEKQLIDSYFAQLSQKAAGQALQTSKDLKVQAVTNYAQNLAQRLNAIAQAGADEENTTMSASVGSFFGAVGEAIGDFFDWVFGDDDADEDVPVGDNGDTGGDTGEGGDTGGDTGTGGSGSGE